MVKVDHMPQSSLRVITEGTDRLHAWLLASSPTNSTGITPPTPPDPEVIEESGRRRFTADYKFRILHEDDDCT